MATKRVVILGGGMAGLAAAYALSATAQLRASYDVTLYQTGWRLGGKCASTRGPHLADPGSQRIEEHGLHVWFGFYYNAFHMIRDCFGELGDPLLSVDTMFRRCSSTPLMEPVSANKWSIWPLDFPEDGPNVEPGVTPGMPSITEAARRIFKFFSDHVHRIAADFPKQAADPVSIAWLKSAVGTALGAQISAVDSALAALFSATFGPAPPTLPSNSFFSAEELAFIGKFISNTDAGNWQQVRLDILALPSTPASNELRRTWLLADLALAVVKGLNADPIGLFLNGFDALDDRDFRQWLAANGAHAESVDSAPVRALYDLCFAYTDGDSSNFNSANFAAGAALRCIVRITMGYKGAVCYTMNAGMGEAVVAPLYRLLVGRGVRFEFFHRVDRIELDAGGQPEFLHFTRQATTLDGTAYDPVFTTPEGLAYWPRQPDFDQLVDGALLEAAGELDMDSDDEVWYGETQTTLKLVSTGGDRADLIVAISIGGLPRIDAEIRQAYPSWQQMINSTLTVATQSAQLWMNVDLGGLGYAPADKPPAMVAAPEPMDVWADMTQVIAYESWTVGCEPASVQYICGPLKGNFADPTAAYDQVVTNTDDWLNVMANAAWTATKAAGAFDHTLLLGPGLKTSDRVRNQHLRANYQSSERYVLSTRGSIAKRLWANAFAGQSLYLAGDWTRNGLNAGCVEAAVMSGLQAAFGVLGIAPTEIPGSTDAV